MTNPKSPWLKRVLVLFWVIQLFTMGVLFAGVGFTLDSKGAHLPASYLVVLVFCAICTILTITEIVLFIRSKLYPITYLTMQAVKTGVWAVVFVLVLIGLQSARVELGGRISGLKLVLGGLVESILTLFAFVATLIYASVIYHRDRKGLLGPRRDRQRLPSTATEIMRPPSLHIKPELPGHTQHPLMQREEVLELADGEEREVGLRLTRSYLELPGGQPEFELAATRSLRSARESITPVT